MFKLAAHIFIAIALYMGAIALVVAAPVYYFSLNAAWWTFFCVFGLLMFYGLNREFGLLRAMTFAIFLIGAVAVPYWQGG
jgi:hypothetical protein